MNNCNIRCGIDVGKWAHHVVAISSESGEILFDGKIKQDEKTIKDALVELAGQGRVGIVIDQPGSMSALLLAIAKSLGIGVGFITPKAMARAIDMYGGDLKSDAHDAMILAEIAVGLPKLIRPIWEKSEEQHRLARLMSYDRELTAESTRVANRLHDLLLSISPVLEEAMKGKAVSTALNLALLSRYGGLKGINDAGRGNVRRWVRSRKGFGVSALGKVDALFDAVGSQTVVVPGTEDVEELIKMEAQRLADIVRSRRGIAAKRDALLEAMPEAGILMSLPGTGAITCATFIAEVGDITRFDNAAKLASYAGLSPKMRQSGTSVHSVTKPRSGNRRLKRVLVLSASKSILFCDDSRKYYERKRREGRCYNSAITALARKRLDVMYAMLRDGTYYEKKNG